VNRSGCPVFAILEIGQDHEAALISLAEKLRCRVRDLTGGVVFVSTAFVEQIFAAFKNFLSKFYDKSVVFEENLINMKIIFQFLRSLNRMRRYENLDFKKIDNHTLVRTCIFYFAHTFCPFGLLQ
jgi:hypothetical protein